jgi:hypothetical protein
VAICRLHEYNYIFVPLNYFFALFLDIPLQRRTRVRQGKSRFVADDFPWDTAESRPLISHKSIEAGEDYWIDEKDLEQERLQQQAISNYKAMEGRVPREKLMTEVKAPYKQNWIGYFSVMIVIISTIVSKFPELLDLPMIPIPDL